MKILNILILLLIFEAALYDAVEFIKPGISTASLTVNDIAITSVYLMWFVLIIFGRLRLPTFSNSIPLYIFIFTMLVPVIVGYFEGHLWQTILRDARAPYYYILAFVVASYVKDEESLKQIIKSLLIVGVLFLIVGYLVYIFKIPVATNLAYTWLKSGKTSRHFGYHTSHLLFLICALFQISYLLNFRQRVGGKFMPAVLSFSFIVGLLLTMTISFF